MLNHLTFVLLFPVHNVNAVCVLIHTCSCIYQMPIYYKTLTLFNRYITSSLFIFFEKHKNRKLYVFTYRYFMKSLIICKCLNFSPQIEDDIHSFHIIFGLSEYWINGPIKSFVSRKYLICASSFSVNLVQCKFSLQKSQQNIKASFIANFTQGCFM